MQTLTFDAEAAGKALFDETFQGTLPLYPTWEEQPQAFRNLMAQRALKVARAAVTLTEDDDVEVDAHGNVICDVGEPETGD